MQGQSRGRTCAEARNALECGVRQQGVGDAGIVVV
jgi:hypothetical protein